MRLMAYKTPEGDEAYPVAALYFDGYQVAERLLEGLVIKVELTEDGQDIKISADWPKGFDVAYWTQKAKEFALERDVFSTSSDLCEETDDEGFIDVNHTS